MRKPCSTWLHACTCSRQRRAEHAARWDRAGAEGSVPRHVHAPHRRWPIADPLMQCCACQTEPAWRAQFNEMRECSDGCAREGMEHECASTDKASGRAHKCFSTPAARTGFAFRRRDPPNLIHYIGDYMVDYMAPIFLPRASAPRGYTASQPGAPPSKNTCARGRLRRPPPLLGRQSFDRASAPALLRALTLIHRALPCAPV